MGTQSDTSSRQRRWRLSPPRRRGSTRSRQSTRARLPLRPGYFLSSLSMVQSLCENAVRILLSYGVHQVADGLIRVRVVDKSLEVLVRVFEAASLKGTAWVGSAAV